MESHFKGRGLGQPVRNLNNFFFYLELANDIWGGLRPSLEGIFRKTFFARAQTKPWFRALL